MRAEPNKAIVDVSIRSRDLVAEHEALRLIQELGINKLPVDPITIAKSLDILVNAQPTTSGVSGMLIRSGDEFAIGYSTRIDNEGFQRFSVAHELGHYRIPGHIEAVLSHDMVHYSNAGFTRDDPYEREADLFAANLLMPERLCTPELSKLPDGLQAVESLAEICITSLSSAAIRYIQLASIPVAMVMSTGQRIEYCFMSKHLKDFDRLTYPRKGASLPLNSITRHFNSNSDNIRYSRKKEFETNLRNWFEGNRNIPGIEEVVGLGSYGKTITILSSEIFVDEEDEDYELEESWRVNF